MRSAGSLNGVKMPLSAKRFQNTSAVVTHDTTSTWLSRPRSSDDRRMLVSALM
jgi:hypothetical protein